MVRHGVISYPWIPPCQPIAEPFILIVSNMDINDDFWAAIDKIAAESKIIIDRPKGTIHPRFPDFLYPVDYGYLDNTSSMDGGGIDVWVGTDERKQIDAILCTIDLLKRDAEIKILIGCTEKEKETVYRTQNEKDCMKGILIRRS